MKCRQKMPRHLLGSLESIAIFVLRLLNDDLALKRRIIGVFKIGSSCRRKRYRIRLNGARIRIAHWASREAQSPARRDDLVMRESSDEVKENNRSCRDRARQCSRARHLCPWRFRAAAKIFKISVTDLNLRLSRRTTRIGLGYDRWIDLLTARAEQNSDDDRDLRCQKTRHEALLVAD